ncbi:N(6)-adenosine-methyltransferase catalytic subunit METTL3-like [Tubulanus polymorphus]|uniref:N(6)-adenosine-methyltransferase catalytic subunit METTL3-like n=1 Tax=Tubulanus polymorphus TaxID=672921 RepID=UPI003DA575B8
MSDTWSDIQAIKNKQSSLREKLLRRRREREGIVADITSSTSSSTHSTSAIATSSGSQDVKPELKLSPSVLSDLKSKPGSRSTSPASSSSAAILTDTSLVGVKQDEPHVPVNPAVEKQLLLTLCDINIVYPCESRTLLSYVSRVIDTDVSSRAIEDLLEKFSAQRLICIEKKKGILTVTSTDHAKLTAVTADGEAQHTHRKRKREKNIAEITEIKTSKAAKLETKTDNSLESLLSMQSSKERENKKLNEEILQLLSKPTAKEQSIVEKFKSQGGAQVKEFCPYGTKDECKKIGQTTEACSKLHFRKIIHKHTDESLGDCSFLNTCFHMDTCKYVHYEIDYPEEEPERPLPVVKRSDAKATDTILYPPQWIQSDIRYFDLRVLGKCAVVMADPPWDIHMELPYGTMSDDEMRALELPALSDDGFIFLWVTGRAMELGRECLRLWGYKRIDELIWVKTNQLQRIIRTGRTGHWLNHGKEHCLVGVKGNPQGVNRGLDADILVAEVRATSHKPDEIYGIIERLSPGTRKVELFGRPHNAQPNWITLGNQLDGVRLLDPEIVKRFREKYPDGNCMGPPKK